MVLAVAVATTIIVTTTLLEDDDLLALRLRDDFGGNSQTVGRLQVRALAGEQDIAQRHRATGFSVDLLDDDLVSGGDAILLAARAHDCEHGPISLSNPYAREGRGPTVEGARLR